MYRRACAETSTDVWECVKCDTASATCCAYDGTSFCTDFYDCDDTTDTCADPLDSPLSCGAIARADQRVNEREIAWDMGPVVGAGKFDIFYSVEADGPVTLEFYEYRPPVLIEPPISTITLEADGEDTLEFDPPESIHPNEFWIVAKVTSPREANWIVRADCP